MRLCLCTVYRADRRSCCGGAGCFAAVRCLPPAPALPLELLRPALRVWTTAPPVSYFSYPKYHSCEKPGLPSGAHCFLSPCAHCPALHYPNLLPAAAYPFRTVRILAALRQADKPQGIRSAVLCISRNGFIRIASVWDTPPDVISFADVSGKLCTAPGCDAPLLPPFGRLLRYRYAPPDALLERLFCALPPSFGLLAVAARMVRLSL